MSDPAPKPPEKSERQEISINVDGDPKNANWLRRPSTLPHPNQPLMPQEEPKPKQKEL